jgi:hypothetical protein
MNPQDIADALEALRPGSGASVMEGPDGIVVGWNRAEPIPDEATLHAALAELPAKRAAREAKIAARRTRLRGLAQGAVGKDAAQLTPNELRAILALLLVRFEVLDDDGAVRPLEEWT